MNRHTSSMKSRSSGDQSQLVSSVEVFTGGAVLDGYN